MYGVDGEFLCPEKVVCWNNGGADVNAAADDFSKFPEKRVEDVVLEQAADGVDEDRQQPAHQLLHKITKNLLAEAASTVQTSLILFLTDF